MGWTISAAEQTGQCGAYCIRGHIVRMISTSGACSFRELTACVPGGRFVANVLSTGRCEAWDDRDFGQLRIHDPRLLSASTPEAKLLMKPTLALKSTMSRWSISTRVWESAAH